MVGSAKNAREDLEEPDGGGVADAEVPRRVHAVRLVLEVAVRGAARVERLNHRQIVFLGKFKIPFIMSRACKNGTRSIIHQNEIRDVKRQFNCSVEWMFDFNSGVDSLFFHLFQSLFINRSFVAFVNKIRDFFVIFGLYYNNDYGKCKKIDY